MTGVIRAEGRKNGHYRERTLVLCYWEGIVRDKAVNTSKRVKDSVMIAVEFEDQIELEFFRKINDLRAKHCEFRHGGRYIGPFPVDIKLLKCVTMKYIETKGKKRF